MSEARSNKPTAVRGLLFIVVIAVILSALVLTALSQRVEGGGGIVLNKAPDPISVQVVRAMYQDAVNLDDLYTGMAIARRSSSLGFETGGRIANIYVDTGDSVEAGAVLAALDRRALRAQLAAAEAQVVEAEAAHRLALSNVERQTTLANKKLAPEQRRDEAVASADSAKARIDSAKAQVQALRVRIDLATLTAPFSGTVTGRAADEGVIASPGAPVITLVETGSMEARIGLPFSSVANFEVGETYTLAAGGQDFSAVFRSASGVVNERNRTVECVFDFNDSAPASGAIVRLVSPKLVEERGFWAPISALTQAPRGLWAIYVAAETEDGWTAELHLVEVIHAESERAYVRGTVEDGAFIISGGLQRITPNMPVDVRENPVGEGA